jgi:hypothetical protein
VLVDGELREGNVIDLRIHPAQTLEIVLGVSTGRIKGHITHGNAPAPVATIALMDEATQWIVKLLRIPADGQFEFTSLAPGNYQLFALEDFDRAAWDSKDLRASLAFKSVVLELHDGESTEISVPLISTVEYKRALQALEY